MMFVAFVIANQLPITLSSFLNYLMAVITVNRVKWNGHARIKNLTPVICDPRINFRGTTATDYNEKDIMYTLFATVLHYGISAKMGHFISYIYRTNGTATFYDETIVRHFNTTEILRSKAFLQNVYICFYIKENKLSEYESDSNVMYTEKRALFFSSYVKTTHKELQRFGAARRRLFLTPLPHSI